MARRIKGDGSFYYSKPKDVWITDVTLPDGHKQKKRSNNRQKTKSWLQEFQVAFAKNRALPDKKPVYSLRQSVTYTPPLQFILTLDTYSNIIPPDTKLNSRKDGQRT